MKLSEDKKVLDMIHDGHNSNLKTGSVFGGKVKITATIEFIADLRGTRESLLKLRRNENKEIWE